MWRFNYTEELYHYGVPGMKWGKRKAMPVSANSVARARAAYKSSNKAYDKAYKEYARGPMIGFTKKQRQRNSENFKKMNAAAQKAERDKQAYKSAKALYKKLGKEKTKKLVENIKAKKAEYKQANKEYNKAYKEYAKGPAIGFTEKQRQKNSENFKKMNAAAQKAERAKQAYKDAKKKK